MHLLVHSAREFSSHMQRLFYLCDKKRRCGRLVVKCQHRSYNVMKESRANYF
jgi:hypothetical protein